MTTQVFIVEDQRASRSLKRYVEGLKKYSPEVTFRPVYIQRRNRWIDPFLKYIVLPVKLMRMVPATILLPSERYAFLLPFLKRSRTVVVCHDLHTLMDRGTAFYHKCVYKILLKLMALADHTVCISSHTKKDLRKALPSFPEERIRVIYNGIEEHWFEREERDSFAAELKGRPFILMVGTAAWYKNLYNAFKALALLDRKDLVIVKVGAVDDAVFRLWKKELNDHPVVHLQHVADRELAWLYQHAILLFMPSLHEGFGWPAIEAMASECPVIASRKGSLEEVCGDAPVYIDPYDVKGMAEAVDRLINLQSLQEDLKKKGILQSRKYPWSLTASAISNLLKVSVPT